MQHIYLKFISF